MSDHKDRIYQDIDGNPVSLDTLCRKEPAWAANRLRALERERDEARLRHPPDDLAPLLTEHLVAAERERDAARAEAREHVREIERLDRRGGEITCERNAAERERDEARRLASSRYETLTGEKREIASRLAAAEDRVSALEAEIKRYISDQYHLSVNAAAGATQPERVYVRNLACVAALSPAEPRG